MNAKEYIRNQPCPVVTAPESPDATRASGDVRDCLKRWLFRCRPNVFSDRLSSRSSIQWVHRRWSCAGRLASALLAARHIQSMQIAVEDNVVACATTLEGLRINKSFSLYTAVWWYIPVCHCTLASRRPYYSVHTSVCLSFRLSVSCISLTQKRKDLEGL